MRGAFPGRLIGVLPAVMAVVLAASTARAQGPERGGQSAGVAADSHLGPVFGAGGEGSSQGRDSVAVERWYGWQTLLTDAASLSLVGIGVATGDSASGSGTGLAIALSAIGAIGYTLGGPIVHFEQGQRDNVMPSLAIRAGLPIGGALAGYLVGLGGCSEKDQPGVPCPVMTSMIGGVTGLGAAVLVDALGLGYGPIEAARGTVVFAPTVQAAQSGVRIGISGAF
jgi:hypothetical protein